MNRTELPAFKGLTVVWQWVGERQNEANTHQMVVKCYRGKGSREGGRRWVPRWWEMPRWGKRKEQMAGKALVGR